MFTSSCNSHRRAHRMHWKTSGNSAFDAYRMDTLDRLAQEQKDFEEFMNRLRNAKDKAEFDEFLNERDKQNA